jgi:hypothetical protein
MQNMSPVRISIDDTLPSEGRYDHETGRITISPIVFNDLNRTANVVIHEIVHKLTVGEIFKWTNYDAQNNVTLKEGAPAYMATLVRMFNNLRAEANVELLNTILKGVRETGKITTEDLDTKYGLTDLREFVTMALTHAPFQQALNKIPYKDSGLTFWEKFKEVVGKVLQGLGVQFDKDYTAAHAISTIFEVLENAQKSTTPVDNEYDPYEYQTNYDDENQTGIGEQLMPGIFPEKALTILNEKC